MSEWHGALPATWQEYRIKNLFSLRDERNFKPMNDVLLLSLYTHSGVLPHDEIERTIGNRATTVENYKIVHEGDMIVNIILCWQGAIGLSKHNGVTSPAYDVYQPRSESVVGRYYHYLMRTPMFSGECYKRGHGIMATRWRTYSDDFMSISVPLPPREEQVQIVRFLDWKVSRINRLIGARKRQIALLQEQKKTLIDAAMPKNGEQTRFRNIFSLFKGLNITKANLVESGIPCVSYGQIHSSYGFEVMPEIHILPCVNKGYLSTNQSSLMKYGDFAFADTSEDIAGSGNFTYVNSQTPVFAGYHTIIARAHGIQNYRYLAYYFDSLQFRKQIQQNVNGVKVFSITRSILKNTLITMPAGDEQKAIVESLDRKCLYNNKLVNKITVEIDLLQEYRTRLVSDVATGKMDVRTIAVPEYEKNQDAALDDDFETGKEGHTQKPRGAGYRLHTHLNGISESPETKAFIDAKAIREC
jgi:type I restriction enzyme S subunit